jgi:hypothetical protein
MITWLLNNISTIIVCVIIIAVVAMIVRKMVKDKKQGKSSCGCGCQNCAMHDACHSNK